MTDAHPTGLSIRNAVKVYPGTRALKGVDFDIRMGAVNVLVGENGAGKLTLMRVIAGVERLQPGLVERVQRRARLLLGRFNRAVGCGFGRRLPCREDGK